MNTAELSFPELDAEVQTAPRAAAPAAPAVNAIAANITNVQGEVAKFDRIALGLKAIEDAHPKTVIVGAIATPAGMKLAETAWRAYRNPRLEVERARKAAKAPVLALGKAIDTFAGGLEDRLREGEDHYKAQIDKEEERKAAEKAEAARIEAERIAKHQLGIKTIRAYLIHCQGTDMTAARIQAGIDHLAANTCPPALWEEFAVEAANAACETLEAMRKLHAQALSREQEEARQVAIRAETARAVAELAEARRQLEEQAAAVRRQQEELAAQRAESDRLEALAVAKRKRLADEQEAREVEQARQTAAAEERAHNAALADALTRAEQNSTKLAPTGEGKAGTPGAGNAETAPNYEAQGPEQVLKAEPATADATDPGSAATASPRVGAMGAGQAADADPAVEYATLNLGAICGRLGFTVDAAFLLDTLHIAPKSRDKRGIGVYTERQFQLICSQLLSRVSAMSELYAGETA